MPGIVDLRQTVRVNSGATIASSFFSVRGLQAFAIAVPTGVKSGAMILGGAYDPSSTVYPIVDPANVNAGTLWALGCGVGSCAALVWQAALAFPFIRPEFTVAQSGNVDIELFGLRR